MNQIVREHCPVDKATITMEAEYAIARPPADDDRFSRYGHIRGSNYHSLEEVNAYVPLSQRMGSSRRILTEAKP